ncbi:MAG: ribonuclease Y [Bacteroidota bacterium]|nr:ribonuclease Y [Bacteroidota bacterium]MDE2955863.1 ribonuclease Y [Bacteroidota bacterium]
MTGIIDAVLLLIVALAAYGAGFVTYKWILVRKRNRIISQSQREASDLLARAEEDVASLRDQAAAEARSEFEEDHRSLESARTALEKEREEIRRSQRRFRNRLDRRHSKLNSRTAKLQQRESLLDKGTRAVKQLQREAKKVRSEAEKLRARAESLRSEAAQRHAQLDEELAALSVKQQALDEDQLRLKEAILRKTSELEQIAGLSTSDAEAMLREELVDQAKLNALAKIQAVRDEATRTAQREARNIVVTAVQRLAASDTLDPVISVVHVKSESVKGHIIGREGRNIRAFEAATGVDVLIDDTPGAVVLSSFDPYRREVARIALSRLLQDGRIHPQSIEKYVASATSSVETELKEIGQRTAIDLGIRGLHKELIRIVGRMRYRSSYGQNLLKHSIEVARICTMIAGELGLDAKRACRAGLLHDIGKVIPDSEELTHALVGMKMCKRYRESEDVCNAVGAHHDEIPMTNLISPIVQAADAISGSRPGARREQYEEYLQRLQDLENIAESYKGVSKAYVIQGGREVRVLVEHERVSDVRMSELADDIAERIEAELQYPGQVKVVVIREVRQMATAR